jgi:putative hydrolase of the HAD superfamily
LIIKAILFDFADTLVHTERFDYDTCLGRIVQRLSKDGISVPFENFKQGYFHSRDRFYGRTEETLEEQDFTQRIRETLEHCGVKVSENDERLHEAAESFSDCFVESLTIESYLPSFLERLHEKYKLAVVSNMSFAEAGYLSLRKFDIAKYFDLITISGTLGWRKPSPRIFREALQALDVKAEEAIFVGDSPRADIEGAKQLGMKTVLVIEGDKKKPSTDTFQFYIREAKSKVKPDKTISGLAKLPGALHDLSRQR